MGFADVRAGTRVLMMVLVQVLDKKLVARPHPLYMGILRQTPLSLSNFPLDKFHQAFEIFDDGAFSPLALLYKKDRLLADPGTPGYPPGVVPGRHKCIIIITRIPGEMTAWKPGVRGAAAARFAW